MDFSRIELNIYEKTIGGEEHTYEQIETAHGNIKKDPVFKIETANGNIVNDPVINLSLRKWLQFVLLPLLIVSVLFFSLILAVVYFSLYAELEAKMEKKYAFLMTKQNINATEVNAIVNEARAELELKMEKKYDFLIAEQNISATEIRALANEPRVALTACDNSGGVYNGAVKFSTVYTQVGINNIAAFKSNGKFVCMIPGLYYISAHIRTNTQNSAFYVYKNNKQISRSASGSGTYTDVPISAVVDLHTNDELFVKVSHDVSAGDSCVTIAKIK